MSDERAAELAANLARVRTRIAAACAAAGRRPDEVTLIAVTKTFPAADVRRLAGLGMHDVGENRAAEAAGKATETADLPLRWHFVGQLQTNKAATVAGFAHWVHSVDRVRLVRALGRAAREAERTLGCLVQVSFDDTPGRGGVAPAGAAAVAAAVAAEAGLRLAGVMAVAPLGGDADAAFARLAELAAGLRAEYPEAVAISAGMSGDLEAALRHGSTHLRVGTALLGGRHVNVG